MRNSERVKCSGLVGPTVVVLLVVVVSEALPLGDGGGHGHPVLRVVAAAAAHGQARVQLLLPLVVRSL
jgi:hypothetical protein